MKESPWYSDDNAPSLYRDRYMRVVAVAVAALERESMAIVAELTAFATGAARQSAFG